MRRLVIFGVCAAVLAGCTSDTASSGGSTTLTPAASISAQTTTTTAAGDSTPRIDTGPILGDALLPGEIQLRVLAVRPDNPSLAILDLGNRTITVYPPGSHALGADAIAGAVMTPNREVIIWTSGGVTKLFAGALDSVYVELGPTSPGWIDGYGPSLRVVPSPQGGLGWLVQPGIGFGTNNHPTLIDYIDLETGGVFWTSRAEPNAFPVAATADALVLNTEQLIDTGDGWAIEPGSQQVLLISNDGSEYRIGEGIAIAASADTLARFVCPKDKPECDLYRNNELVLTDADGANSRQIVKPFEGTWMTVGGPSIPSDALPLQTISPDGSELLVRLGEDLDVNGVPAQSRLLIIDLSHGTTRPIAEHQGETPIATWSHDGKWVVLFNGTDITLINADSPDTTITLTGAIPKDHFVLAAG